MTPTSAKPIGIVVHQHAEESAHLRHVRSVLVAAPHVKLHHLRRLDDRLAAHLDGLAVAGEFGSSLCGAALENPGVGEVFAAAVRAIEEKDERRLDKLFALVGAVPEAQPGLISAFGWVSANYLQGTGTKLLASKEPLQRLAGIAACAMHGVDPGATLTQAATNSDPQLRARALRAAGELGRRDLLPTCEQYLGEEDATCRFWAAWSAVLLGDRAKAVEVLKAFSLSPGPFRERALQLALKVMALKDAHALLKAWAQDTANLRLLIQGSGVVGDPLYVPWLLKQMNELKTTRLAGEAFSLITGLNLAYLDLERKPPEGVDFGPTDDPADDNVAMDPDDDLPWPDADKIQAWWDVNKPRFQEGVRYFMGEPVSAPHCQKILRDGYQCQRIAAAQYLCLSQPGTALFNTSAPAWRQLRRLGKMVSA